MSIQRLHHDREQIKSLKWQSEILIKDLFRLWLYCLWLKSMANAHLVYFFAKIWPDRQEILKMQENEV